MAAGSVNGRPVPALEGLCKQCTTPPSGGAGLPAGETRVTALPTVGPTGARPGAVLSFLSAEDEGQAQMNRDEVTSPIVWTGN